MFRVELILKLACEKKIELDIDEIALMNHVVVVITSGVPPLAVSHDKKQSLIQFETFELH